MGDAELHLTFVILRPDQLLGGVWASGADDSNVDSQVEAAPEPLHNGSRAS